VAVTPGVARGGRWELRIGLRSERGERPRNEDYAAAWLGDAGAPRRRDIIAAVADGVGGAKGGREAAEIAVRGLIDGLLGQSEMLPVSRAAARAIEPLNRWLHTMGRTDPGLAGMATTLSAVVLRGRRLHLLHVGDSRVYRLRAGQLTRLTSDHRPGGAGFAPAVTRALGFAEAVSVDYAEDAAEPLDRLLLCTDGVHGVLPDRRIAAELARRDAPEETARRLVAAALAAPGAQDNATALILDLLDVPPVALSDIAAAIAALPIAPPPRAGQMVDGYALDEMLADGRDTRVFRGRDTEAGDRPVVLKFPKPGSVQEALFRDGFLREAWIASHLRSPFLGEVILPPAGRQARLYAVLPFYAGETLERRILRGPPPGLEAGVALALKLGKAVAALHRAGVIHRDIKPDNVVLTPDGGLRLIDFGVAGLPALDEAAMPGVPGTASYMAPELLAAATPGDARSDIYALGVTLYRLFSGGAYPYGEVEPFSRPRFGRPAPLAAHRPDLPAWLDGLLARAVAVAPEERFGDAIELVFALEHGLARGGQLRQRPRALYDRNPLLFWQLVAAALAILLLVVLLRTAGAATGKIGGGENSAPEPPPPFFGLLALAPPALSDAAALSGWERRYPRFPVIKKRSWGVWGGRGTAAT